MKRSGMWRSLWLLVGVVLLTVAGVAIPAQAAEEVLAPHPLQASGPAREGGIVVRESTPERLVLELRTADLQMEEVELDGQRHIVLAAQGLDDAAGPGEPRLPQAGALIGLPPSGNWSVRVKELERTTIPVHLPIAPAPELELSTAQLGTPRTVSGASWTLDQTIYGTDAVYPSSSLVTGESTLLRDLRVVRLGFHPVRYNPVRGELEHIGRLIAEIRFEEPAAGTPPAPDVWDDILSQAVVNYETARNWRGVRPQGTPAALNPMAAAPGSFKVEVDADGLYALTFERLWAAGFPVTDLDPTNLHMLAGGQEVAIQVQVGPDGVFSPGDRILFYGQAATGRFTKVNIYWLALDETPGLRMGTRIVTPQDVNPTPSARWITTHYEENHLYDAMHPEPSGDHWYWTDLAFLQTGCPEASQLYSFDTRQIWGGIHSVTLRISVQGYTYSNHTLEVTVNDHYLGNVVWKNLNRKEKEFTFPADWLEPQGENWLQLDNGDCPPPPPPSPAPNGMAFNYFELDHLTGYRATDDVLDFMGEAGNRQYELDGFSGPDVTLFDITDLAAPIALTRARVESDGHVAFQDRATTPRRYYVAASNTIREPTAVYRDWSSNLTSSSAGADYLLIGYRHFLAATQPLVDLRAAQGLLVMSVDVQDVYDEFSHGVLDPAAIQDFLAYAATQWQVPPTYVLLVGDGTIDYHDYLGQGWHNYVPAYPAYVDLHVGPFPAETASDKELDPGPELPFYLLGRLTVSSAAETRDVVSKIVTYETSPAPGFWNRRILFTADDDDHSGPFTDYSDQVLESIAEPFIGDRVYLSKSPQESHEYKAVTSGEAVAAQTSIIDRFVAGRLFISFMGHASYSQWAKEVLLHRRHVPQLQSNGKLPIILSMTCHTGAFHVPTYSVIDEELLLEPAGGAVAAWGSTGAGIATGHRHLAIGALDAVQASESVTMGQAVFAGLSRLYVEAPLNRDLIPTYVLLGDPAMSVQRFTGTFHAHYMPLVTKREP